MMFPFSLKPPSDPSQVPVIDMRMLIIIHAVLAAFMLIIHFYVESLHDF